MENGMSGLYLVIGIIAALLCLAAFLRAFFRRSLMASIAAIFLRIRNRGQFDSAAQADAYMKKRSEVEDSPYKIPGVFRNKMEMKEISGCRTLVIRCKKDENPERIVLYLHGGAYVNEISVFHLSFCVKLAQILRATVYAPLYPLAPNHACLETYPILGGLYDSIIRQGLPICMMGDSAGGGLAATFCEYLAEKHVQGPEHLILLSPWVDVSMSGNYEPYIKTDPMLGVPGLRRMGEVWAGDLGAQHYMVSPLFGSTKEFPDTLIFTGTREILFPDIVSFHEKLVKDGSSSHLVIGENMNHVYPIYPIPEAKSALRKIVNTITKKNGEL